MTGAVVSRTMTRNVFVALKPCVSAAVAVTMLVPSANVLPLAGFRAGVSAPSSASLAVTVKLTALPPAFVASIVMVAGTVITGAALPTPVSARVNGLRLESLFVICNVAERAPPAVGEKITLNVVLPSTTTEAGRVIPPTMKLPAFAPVATTFERIKVARPELVTVSVLVTLAPTFTVPKAGALPPLVSVVPDCWTTIPATPCNRSLKSFTVATLL